MKPANAAVFFALVVATGLLLALAEGSLVDWAANKVQR